MILTTLQRRIVDLAYTNGLTHLSSALNTVCALESVYLIRGANQPVVLGNSHAALALFVVLEQHGLCDAAEMIQRHGTHACRDMEHDIWVSGGSLGQPETIAVGLAMCTDTTVWLVTSDGACMEGSVSEAFRMARSKCPNLHVDVIYNGYGAYGPIELNAVREVVRGLSASIYRADKIWKWPPWMSGLAGHYIKLNEAQYKELIQDEANP